MNIDLSKTCEDSAARALRLTDEQMLYVRSMGKALRVTAIAGSADDANAYLEKHRNEGVIAEFGQFVFIANLDDRGASTPQEFMHE